MMHLLKGLFCSTFLLDCSGRTATVSVGRRPSRLSVGHIDETMMSEQGGHLFKVYTMARGYLKSW
jgi:hypothetical protein